MLSTGKQVAALSICCGLSYSILTCKHEVNCDKLVSWEFNVPERIHRFAEESIHVLALLQ